MKRYNSIPVLILMAALTAIVMAVNTPVLASDSLHNHLSRNAFTCQWLPISPNEGSSSTFMLETDDFVTVHIEIGSGVRIETSQPAADSIQLFQTLCTLPQQTGTHMIALDQSTLCYRSETIIEFPVTASSGMDLVIRSLQPVRVSLSSYHSTYRPYYWETLGQISARLLKSGQFQRAIQTEIDRVYAMDDWSMSGMWVRAIDPVLQTMKTTDQPDHYLADQICLITDMFASLASEDTITDTLDHWISPETNITDQTLSLPGPGWIRGFMVAQLDPQTDRTVNQLPLTIRVNERRTGHWPHGHCRFLRDNALPTHSKPLFFRVYLPETDNRIQISSDTELTLSGSLTQSIYPCQTHQKWYAACPDLIDLIPVNRRFDTIWLTRQLNLHGENPVLQTLLTHYANRRTWTTVEGSAPLTWILDPATERGNVYGLQDNLPVTLHIAESMDLADKLQTIHLFDPDRNTTDAPAEIILNGHQHVSTLLQNPYTSRKMQAVPVFPGTHTLAVNGSGRDIYLNVPVTDTSPEPLTLRRYAPVSESCEPVIYALNGGTNGQWIQLYLRNPQAPVQLYLDGSLWKTMETIPVNPSNQPETDMVIVKSEFVLPAGHHELWVETTDSTLMAAVKMQVADELPASSSLIRDPLMETIITTLTTPPEMDALSQRITRLPAADPERLLLLALAGDAIRARDMFLATDYNARLASHRMILSWLYTETGHENLALETAWPLVTDATFPYCEAFFERLLHSALQLGGFHRAGMIAWIMAQNDSQDPDVPRMLQFLEKPRLVSPTLSQLANSSAQRFIKIPHQNTPAGTNSETTLHTNETIELQAASPTAHTLTLDIPQTTMLRLKMWAPEPLDTMTTTLAIRSSDVDTELTFPLSTVEKPRTLIIPVREPGQVILECQKGAIIVDPAIQLVSLKDCLVLAGDDTPETTDDTPVDDTLIDRITALLNRMDDPDQATVALATAQQLLLQWPHASAVQNIYDLLADTRNWKRLSGWPEHSHGRRYVSYTDVTHDPLIELRGMDVPDPVAAADTWLMTRRQSLQFDMVPLGHGRLKLELTALPETEYHLTVELDRRMIGQLTWPETSLEIPWQPGRGKRMRIRAETISGRFPVKLGVTHISSTHTDQLRSIPLWGNRRYNQLLPGNHTPMTGRIIGPACLKLRFRAEMPRQDSCRVKIDAYTVDQTNIWQETIQLPTDVDPYCQTVPEGTSVGVDSEVIIPLTDDAIYQLTVTHIHGSSPVLIRAYAMQVMPVTPDSDTSDIDLSCVDETTPTATATDDATAKTCETAMDTEPVDELTPTAAGALDSTPLVWNTGIDSDYEYRQRHRGTWSISAGYRDREADTDNDSAETGSDSDSTDGAGATIAWNRGIQLASGHKIYLETSLGATYPLDDPDALIGRLRQMATWHIGDSGYRGRISGLAVQQTINDSSQWRYRLQADIRRTFRLSAHWSWLIAAGGFISHQTLEPEDLAAMSDPPGPDLYTAFNERHQSGGTLMTQLSVRPVSRLMFYLRGRTITAGDDESGIFGPWWVRGGIRGMFGVFTANAYYEERQSFGSSLEPDRSRIGVRLSLYQWFKSGTLLELSVSDRYTLDEEWNDIEATLSLRFSHDRLLKDFDPFRKLYRKRIESLSR